ncbi:4-coumarate--CoA ligase 2-like [Contarinia nasturtii]|uniref:4-coumarate--CoA ligase 2-like n=1 Tax=Contarinia nasturtii TaxID=265458 RepID=UPI0012D40ECF|nr:4-coumarate--CoA ligase 2-like [Contarinia nasturtii]
MNFIGVALSHAAILDSATRLESIIEPSDVTLSFNILCGIRSTLWFMATSLNGLTCIVNPGEFSPDLFFEIVEQFKVTSSPTSAYKLLDSENIETANLWSIKHYLCSGSKSSLNLIQSMNKYLKGGKFSQASGMSEASGYIAMNLAHSDNDCAEENHDDFDDEGFFPTGDTVRFDENGDMFIIDRKKELFTCNGYHVMPAEIEGFLNNLDGIQQSCVVPIPDLQSGNIPAALIVKNKESTCNEDFIYASALNHFAHCKRLQGGVYFVDSIPMTETGKFARRSAIQLGIGLYNQRKQ